MQPNPVVWFEIYVQDMARARKFYEAVLATKLETLPAPDSDMPEMEMMAFPMRMGAPGAAGALVKMKGVPSGGATMIYFGCDNCAVEAARVEKAGGRVDRPKFSIGQYGAIALCVDTEGNMFGLHSMN